MFSKLVWQDDQVLLNDLVFQFENAKGSGPDLGDQQFRLHKCKRFIEEYQQFWSHHPGFQKRHVLELGIFQGGSIAFWCELWKPEKFVGVDFQNSEDSAYFQKWRSSRGLDGRVKTYWRTNQTDATALHRIVREDFGGHLDLVIDDASHRYEPTKKSFEVLFPLLREGGLYIIEDWSWGCWANLPLDFCLPHGTELPKLVAELAEATGSVARSLVGVGSLARFKPLITAMEVYPDFVVLERGPGAPPPEFSLASYITRRPTKQIAPA